jgi:hypothetical protein
MARRLAVTVQAYFTRHAKRLFGSNGADRSISGGARTAEWGTRVRRRPPQRYVRRPNLTNLSGGGLNPLDNVSLQVTIETGNDDARADSEIWITIDGATMCLKPSNNASSDAICNNGGSASDQNGNQGYGSPSTDGPQTFPDPGAADMGAGSAAFAPSPHLGSLQLQLMSHDSQVCVGPVCVGETDDNWDIQGIQVTGTQRNGGTQTLPSISPASSPSSSNCVARLKGSPNASTVSFTLDGITNGHTYVNGTSSEEGEVTTRGNNGS